MTKGVFKIMSRPNKSWPFMASNVVWYILLTAKSLAAIIPDQGSSLMNNNKYNKNHHCDKILGACLIPNGNVYIELRMICCELFTRLNNSTDSSDVMPVTSGSCLSG